MMIARPRSPAVFACLLVASPLLAGATEAAEPAPRAVATEVMGSVTVQVSGDGSPPHRLRLLDRLPAAGILVVPAQGRLAVLCSTDHLVRLQGPVRWQVSEAGCRQGIRQPVGTFRGVLPEQGRLVRFGDVLALEMVTRDLDDPGVPVLLAPRNTSLVAAEKIVWTPVAGALQYELRLDAPVSGEVHQATIDAAPAACGGGLPQWPGMEVCSVPWSALGAGDRLSGTAYLSVAARLALGAPPRQEPQPSRLAWLSGEDPRLSASRSADPFLDAVLAARSALGHGLLEDARRRLVEALAVREAAELRITLGDVYMQIGLPRLAAESYRQAEQAPPPTGAAALYGLGRVSYAMRHYTAARRYFARAAELFAVVKLAEESERAERSAAAAARHLSN